jgi:hypothetical protein
MSPFVCVAPAPAQFFGGAPIDGIKCESMEGSAQHIHSHLQIFDRGRAVTVPASIGIPLGQGCLYWVHTHSNDGLIHIESPVKRAFTLGDFFDIWGKDLTPSIAGPVHGRRLTVTVNGKPYAGDPRRIVLADRQEIVIQNGPPFGHPVAYDWKTM